MAACLSLARPALGRVGRLGKPWVGCAKGLGLGLGLGRKDARWVGIGEPTRDCGLAGQDADVVSNEHENCLQKRRW
jgi:hypothetical protein